MTLSRAFRLACRVFKSVCACCHMQVVLHTQKLTLPSVYQILSALLSSGNSTARSRCKSWRCLIDSNCCIICIVV